MPSPIWPHVESPFHPGEQEAQQRLGIRDRMEDIGRRMVRAEMPDQHRTLFEALPWLVVGAADEAGRLWATLLTGPPGFVASPSPSSLAISALPAQGDPLSAAIDVGRSVGLLGIELSTRRRNRANGVVARRSASGFDVLVEQSFGNCPKYIQKRDVRLVGESDEATQSAGHRAAALDGVMTRMLREADTFFLATAAPGSAHNRGCDVSHRGGRPGFVSVGDDGTAITWPDFEGNYMFNTIGNLLLEPRAGLVVADFHSGDLLQVTGRAEVIWDGAEVEAFEGAQRLIRMQVDEALLRPRALALRGQLLQVSPFLTGTGVW